MSENEKSKRYLKYCIIIVLTYFILILSLPPMRFMSSKEELFTAHQRPDPPPKFTDEEIEHMLTCNNEINTCAFCELIYRRYTDL